MSRLLTRIVSGSVLVAAAVMWSLAPVAGQGGGQPSTSRGEWPHYTADVKGTRYSPLDQINASNFNKLEVAWRFKTDSLGPRPEYKLEGTPLDGQRRPLHDRPARAARSSRSTRRPAS